MKIYRVYNKTGKRVLLKNLNATLMLSNLYGYGLSKETRLLEPSENGLKFARGFADFCNTMSHLSGVHIVVIA